MALFYFFNNNKTRSDLGTFKNKYKREHPRHLFSEEVAFLTAHVQAYKNVKLIPIEQHFGTSIACSLYGFREL
jgi:hypothetical protein